MLMPTGSARPPRWGLMRPCSVVRAVIDAKSGAPASSTCLAANCWTSWPAEPLKRPHSGCLTSHRAGVTAFGGRRWSTQIANWHHARVTNAATEAADNLIKRVKRVAFGFTNFDNYRIRALLYAGKPNWNLLNTLTPPQNAKSRIRGEAHPLAP